MRGKATTTAMLRALRPSLCALLALPSVAHAAEGDLRGRFDEPAQQSLSRINADAQSTPLIAVTINGANVLPAAQLASAYEGYLTTPVTMDDLAVIAQTITDRYRAEGYFLSRAVVPPQDLASGVARIDVIEGRITSVSVQGPGADAAAAYLRSLDGDAPARLSTLDQHLALANDAPGLTLRTHIEPDIDDPSQHRLVVDAEAKRINAYAMVDNRGSDDAGPIQASARIDVNSAFRAGDRLTFRMFGTPSRLDEFASAGATYYFQLADRAHLSVGGSTFRAGDGADASSPEIGGDGAALRIQYERALSRTRSEGLWLGASFDTPELRYDWNSGGGYVDNLRVARVYLRGTLNEAGRATNWFAQGSFGLDALGASGHSSTRRSRADADASFAKLNLHVSHYRDIGSVFGVYASFDAQAANEALLYSEEFAAGGAPYGRGYDFGEITGDRGVAGLVEWRAGFDPDGDAVSFVQGFAFFDAAQVWNQDASASLASAGAGVRVRFAERLTATAELARPLTRTPYAEDDKDWRPHFVLTAAY